MKVSVAVVLYVLPHSVCVGNTISMDADSVNNCWVSAGKRYSVDPWLLYTISSVESGMNPLAVNVNKDESRDLGLMQINSWLKHLKHDKTFVFKASSYAFKAANLIKTGGQLVGEHYQEQAA